MSSRMEASLSSDSFSSTCSGSELKLLGLMAGIDDDDERMSEKCINVVAISRLVALRSFSWARSSLESLPIRLTLENVGGFMAVLAAFMPKAVTYTLIYPIYRLLFGTLYPAYASYKAVRTKNVKEYVKWMMYWIVFALFTCAETFTDVFFSFWFPFYYEIKIILVLWLLSPATKGSSILYRRFVHPALCKRESEIDEALARATEQGYSAVLQLGSKGVNYATTVLMQTAIKNIPKVVPSVDGQLPMSQSDSAISSLANRKEQSETDGIREMKKKGAVQKTTTTTKSRRRTRSAEFEESCDLAAGVSFSSYEDSSMLDDVQLNYLNDFDINEIVNIIDSPVKMEKQTEHDMEVEFPEEKGGGGLVQHLKKSYSLSDLTGENEDLNKNTQSLDEVDHDDSQRREKTGRKGFSPRRTQSINNEMDVYFPEVNVEMQKSASKESFASLTNIKSSEDISSGYSSAEALHLQSNRGLVISGNRLERTTSVGARVRSKPRSSIKKIPEGEENFERQLSADILSQLSPEQARELIAYLSKNREQAENDSFQELQDSSESDDDSSTLKADPLDQSQDNKKFDPESVANVEMKELSKDDKSDGFKVVDSCSDKMDELKKLLHDTKATVGSLISSQEDINLSKNTSECIERAGKYRKKPAPKVPINDEDEPEARPVKATLVIKPGRVKNFSNNKDFLAFQRRKQMIAKTATKDNLTKFLTIPKSIFHNTFHKEKDDDSRSISSGKFRSRSGSCETIKFNIDDALKDLADAPISCMNDNESCNNSKLDHLSESSSTVTQRRKSESTDV
ncbi:hypothetical protein TKK_0011018 [Trichogramma kaykai]